MTEWITVRQETKDDFKEVFDVNHIAFGQDNEAKLVDALRSNPIVFVPKLSIVATDNNNKIVGHMAVGVSRFIGQESAKFEVQFFEGTSVLKSPVCGVAANRCSSCAKKAANKK